MEGLDCGPSQAGELRAVDLGGNPGRPLGPDTGVWVLEDCLGAAGYEPVRCDPGQQRSSEALRLLREAGLIMAEFGSQDPLFQQVYAAAHGLGLPAIRMWPSSHAEVELPWILRGDPGGYENDIVVWTEPEDLVTLIQPRIEAVFRLSPALGDALTSQYLQSKRYSQFFVFISHTLKPPHRELVTSIFSLLKERHVAPFEYHQVNTAGMDWRVSLQDSLQKTTHFVALLSPDYEQSPTCTYELEEILKRGDRVSILPFMVAGRSVPNPKLVSLHNTLLPSHDPRTDAKVVVEQVMAQLDHALS